MSDGINPHDGSAFEEFLAADGLREDVHLAATKAVIAAQLLGEMTARKISARRLAKEMGTSRTQVGRLLDPTNDAVSVASLAKAARAIGKRLRVELVDPV